MIDDSCSVVVLFLLQTPCILLLKTCQRMSRNEPSLTNHDKDEQNESAFLQRRPIKSFSSRHMIERRRPSTCFSVMVAINIS